MKQLHPPPAKLVNFSIRSLILLTITALLFFLQSCKKEKQTEELNMVQNDPYIESLGIKVNDWLLARKQESIPEKADKIQKLTDNLELKKLYTEPLGDTETLIIIPLKKDFVSENYKDKNPINYFLGILNRNSELRRGNIVQFIQSGNTALKAVPKNTFYKLYKDNNPDINGSLAFLGIADDLQYEMSYVNGKFKTFSIKQLKPKATGGRGNGTTVLQCWDTYWVTWDENGSARWEYLYSYCEDDCNTTRNVREGSFRTDCGGGGGTGGEDEEYNALVAEATFTSVSEPGTSVTHEIDPNRIEKTFTWKIASNLLRTTSFHSVERAVKVRSNVNSNDWHWISIEHLNYYKSGFSVGVTTTWNLTATPHVDNLFVGMGLVGSIDGSFLFRGNPATIHNGINCGRLWGVND